MCLCRYTDLTETCTEDNIVGVDYYWYLCKEIHARTCGSRAHGLHWPMAWHAKDTLQERAIHDGAHERSVHTALESVVSPYYVNPENNGP